jgi:hypothetical protein
MPLKIKSDLFGILGDFFLNFAFKIIQSLTK